MGEGPPVVPGPLRVGDFVAYYNAQRYCSAAFRTP